MLLTTGIVALSRKVADEKAKKQEARQGQLKVGDSDVAKRAFAAQTTKIIEAGSTDVNRTGPGIKYEYPNEINAGTPTSPSSGIYSPDVEVRDARQSSQVDVSSHVKSEKGQLAMGSPSTETPVTPTNMGDATLTNNRITQPPPYSPRPESSASAISPSVYSRDSDNSTLAHSATKSITSPSTNARGTHAIRVKTKGTELKSGFRYHPALFDLHVHPEKWEAFTEQVVQSVKLETKDYAAMIGAATATAMTGAIATSVWVGKNMKRSLQEQNIKAGLDDMSDGGLGDTLRQWNEDYFSKLGLFVHMELSESAMKNPDQRSKRFRKPGVFYSDKLERARKEEERKFVMVVTKLDEEGQPTEAMAELSGAEAQPVEMSAGQNPSFSVAELPGDEAVEAVELPAVSTPSAEKKIDPPGGYVEMSSDNTMLLEKMHIEVQPEDR